MNRRMWSFNAREIRVQTLVLAVSIWGFAAFNLATPGMFDRTGSIKGGDFVHFYVLGHIAANGRGESLYDAQAQKALQAALVPAARDFWFLPVYGPQTALIFAPISRLPYLSAAFIWALLTIACYLACVWALWRTCPGLSEHRFTVLAAALGFMPLYRLVTSGQTSALPMVCLTAAYLALRSDRKWAAGIALGSLVIKPQFGIAVAVVMLACRERRVIAGAFVGAAAQWGVSALVFGPNTMAAYLQGLWRGVGLATLLEPDLVLQHSPRAFWMLLVSRADAALLLYAVTGVAVLILTVRLWQSSVALEVRYSALVLATMLTSPHVGLYDLVLSVPAFILTADSAERSTGAARRRVRVLLCASYVAVFAMPVAALTRIQPTVPAFGLWLLVLHHLAFRSPRVPWKTAEAKGLELAQRGSLR